MNSKEVAKRLRERIESDRKERWKIPIAIGGIVEEALKQRLIEDLEDQRILEIISELEATQHEGVEKE